MKWCLSFIFSLIGFSILHAQKPSEDSLYHVQDSVLIPTKSGFPISAIVVRKKLHTTALPVILFYTTYYQGDKDINLGKRAADKDYVGVVAYARGIKTNINNYFPFKNEAADIYDIIDWISKQNWSNGSVGMYGGSYTGFAQWAATKKLHPALKTIVPQVAVMPGFDFPMENNVTLSHTLSWINDNIYKLKPLSREIFFDYFNNGIAYNKLDSLAGYTNPIFQEWLKHNSYNNYWKKCIPTPFEFSKINIPVLTTTGYFDGSQISALQYFILHNKYNKNANHYFVIGPYDHWGGQRKPVKNLMGYTIDSVANIGMLDLAFQWLNYILKKQPKPSLLKNKINFEVMDANIWKHASSFSSINTDTLILYFSKNGLTKKPASTPAYVEQIINFNDRETQNSYYTPQLIFDSLDASNGLVFKTNPLKKDFTINGSFFGNLVASINKKDMDISLALYEQRADSSYFFLTRFIGRASYALNSSKRVLLTPNKKKTIPYNNTRFISKKINKGSRLVVLLNINKHPFEIINYGSGKPVAEENILDAGTPLKIKWYNNSFIKIPVNTN